MSYNYLQLVDPETGESFFVERKYCINQDPVEKDPPKPLQPYKIQAIECREWFVDFLKPFRNSLGNKHVKVDKDVLNILLEKELTVGALALLAYLARSLYYKNYVYFKFNEFVEDVELNEKTTYRHFANLVKKGYIKEVETQVPSKEAVIAMNPNIFFVGPESLRADAIKLWYMDRL